MDTDGKIQHGHEVGNRVNPLMNHTASMGNYGTQSHSIMVWEAGMLGCVNELHVGAGPLDIRVSLLRTKDNSDLFAAQIEHSISGVMQSPSLALHMRCLLSSDAGLMCLSHG